MSLRLGLLVAGATVVALCLWLSLAGRLERGTPGSTASAPADSSASGAWRRLPRSPISPSAAKASERIELGAQPPANAGDDDGSPVLARIRALVQPTPRQEVQLRAVWKTHEDGRRGVLAQRSPSAAPVEVYFRDRLTGIDSELEMALVSTVLDPNQRERVLAAIGHTYPPSR